MATALARGPQPPDLFDFINGNLASNLADPAGGAAREYKMATEAVRSREIAARLHARTDPRGCLTVLEPKCLNSQVRERKESVAALRKKLLATSERQRALEVERDVLRCRLVREITPRSRRDCAEITVRCGVRCAGADGGERRWGRRKHGAAAADTGQRDHP